MASSTAETSLSMRADGPRRGCERGGCIRRGGDVAVGLPHRADGESEITRRLKTVGGILLEAVRHDFAQAAWNAARQFRRLGPQDRLHRVHGGLALEWRCATQHLVQHHAEAEDVAAMVGVGAPHLLW